MINVEAHAAHCVMATAILVIIIIYSPRFWSDPTTPMWSRSYLLRGCSVGGSIPRVYKERSDRPWL